jgi:acyl-CoA reductase-like NAD-dependent aldehyde dehydrogenase
MPSTTLRKQQIQTTISPVTQKPVLTRPLLDAEQLDTVVADAVKAQKTWRKTTIDERIAIAEKWIVSVPKTALTTKTGSHSACFAHAFLSP